jgi:hypothetical protein
VVEAFYGRGGDDFIDGGGGLDRANYWFRTDDNITGGITVNLAAGTVDGDASVGHDTLRSIESVRATNFADTYDATGFGQAGALNIGSNGTFNAFEGFGGGRSRSWNGARDRPGRHRQCRQRYLHRGQLRPGLVLCRYASWQQHDVND